MKFLENKKAIFKQNNMEKIQERNKLHEEGASFERVRSLNQENLSNGPERPKEQFN